MHLGAWMSSSKVLLINLLPPFKELSSGSLDGTSPKRFIFTLYLNLNVLVQAKFTLKCTLGSHWSLLCFHERLYVTSTYIVWLLKYIFSRHLFWVCSLSYLPYLLFPLWYFHFIATTVNDKEND